MWYGVPPTEMQRLEYYQVSLSHQVPIPVKRPCPGTTRIFKISGRRYPIKAILEESHRQDHQEIK